MNGIVIARGGTAEVVTLSDRLRPPGRRLRRRLDPRLPGVGLRRPARALRAGRGPRRRGARPPRRHRLPAADRPSRRLGRGRRGRGPDPGRPDGRSRPPRDRASTSIDVALRFALGEPVPDEVARPRFQQPLAIRFLTAEPGPLPDRARDADRQPRARALGRGRRPGRHLPAGRRDDPARAPRRRPARLRDRGRRHQRGRARPGRGGGAAAHGRGRSRELRLRSRRTTASSSPRHRRAAIASRTSTARPPTAR